MNAPPDYDVAIIGAGPVGLTCANLLGASGIRCLLVEQNTATPDHPRAQTLDDESLRTLQSFGLGEYFLEKTLTADGSEYYDDEGKVFARVGPGSENYGFPKRNYMLQQQLDETLLRNLGNYPAVTALFATQLTHFEQQQDCVRLDLLPMHEKPFSATAAYMLACDGGRSSVRQALGINMTGRTYEQDWIVLDAIDDPDRSPVSRFFCNPARPGVSIASPNGGRRYEFMLLPGEQAEAMLQPASLAALLKPFRPYDEKKIIRKTVYTFHARIAERFRDRRIVLLGDAAHLSPPFAGQGLNTGIRDAHNVAWKIAAVVRGAAQADILDSYETERRAPTWSMIQLAVAMGDFVMPRSSEQQTLKTLLMQTLSRFPEARDYIFQMRFKPKPRYTAGLFLDLDEQAFENSLVGEMIPQPRVAGSAGKVRFDDVLGAGFALLAQDEAAGRSIEQLRHPLWQRLQPRCVRLYHDRPSKPAESALAQVCIEPAEKPTARPLLTHRDQLLLLRPDRYVLAAFFPAQLEQVAKRLEILLAGA